MDEEIQFFRKEDLPNRTNSVGSVTVTARSPSELARFVTAIESLYHLLPGITDLAVDAPELTRTFYGWDVDIWKKGTDP